MSAFPHLLSPARIGNLTLRNRIVLTGHGTGMPTDGTPNDQLIRYYEERARGEVGLVMVGSQQVHPTSPGITGLLCNTDDRIVPGLARLAETMHRHGTKVMGYLSHMGLASTSRPVALWSASPVSEQKYGEVAHAMTEAEIAEIVEAFAAAAARCVAAGMDGIEVHCGHGLLLQQFLSPLTNHRTDRYGGSPENRIRFPAVVLAAVRARIGPDVPLGIRCSGDELVPGGLSVDDMCRVVPDLVAAGALDFVDVSAGTDGDLVSNMLHEPPMGLPPVPFGEVARRIRAVAGVPVIHGTRVHSAEAAEALIAAGAADLAGMCRALIADPHLPRKAREGRTREVIPCVACEQACFGRLFRGRHISCVGNPATGREARHATLAPAPKPRSVLVVGGGPAGIEAARVAALRGHSVTLLERGVELGGRMRLAALPQGRGEWRRLLDQRIAALLGTSASVRLRAEADVAAIVARAPDMVILATGARPGPVAIEGAATGPLVRLDDAVREPGLLGGRVLVIDRLDRAPAFATAISLAATGREVELVTEAFHAGQKLEIQNLTWFWRRAAETGLVLTPGQRPVRIEGGAVTFAHVFSRAVVRTARYDSIVLADPGVPDDGLLGPLARAGFSVRAIGDAYAPRDIEAAILDGFELAATL